MEPDRDAAAGERLERSLIDPNGIGRCGTRESDDNADGDARKSERSHGATSCSGVERRTSRREEDIRVSRFTFRRRCRRHAGRAPRSSRLGAPPRRTASAIVAQQLTSENDQDEVSTILVELADSAARVAVMPRFVNGGASCRVFGLLKSDALRRARSIPTTMGVLCRASTYGGSFARASLAISPRDLSAFTKSLQGSFGGELRHAGP
jgi:hypothetical protein